MILRNSGVAHREFRRNIILTKFEHPRPSVNDVEFDKNSVRVVRLVHCIFCSRAESLAVRSHANARLESERRLPAGGAGERWGAWLVVACS